MWRNNRIRCYECYGCLKVWLEAALEDGVKIHEPDSLENYSGQFKLRIPKSLHRSLAEHSQREGISLNQYFVYLLSKNDAVYSKQRVLISVKNIGHSQCGCPCVLIF